MRSSQALQPLLIFLIEVQERRKEHMSYVNAILRLGTRQMAHLLTRPRSFGHPTADMPQNSGIIRTWLI